MPQSLAALYALLGLVAPGLVFQRLREKDLPPPENGPFREISRIVLSSLVFTWLSVMLLALVSSLVPALWVDLADWVEQGGSYLQDHFWLVVWSATVEVALACLIGFIASRVLVARWALRFGARFGAGASRKTPVLHTTPWYEALQGSMSAGEVPWVLVTTLDGTKMWGKVFRYTLHHVAADQQQLVLTGPGLATQATGEKRKEETYWEYVIVNGAQIASVKVARSR